MHQQLVVVLLVGLVASISALDLSHAAKRSTEVDPRIFGFISDLYAQVIYPPLNHIVTNLALLGAQVLAGISESGIPAPGGRTIHLSEAELRDFWSGLWNNAIKPPIEDALSSLALMVAQVAAGIGLNGVNLGIGKRDMTQAEMRDFFDSLTQALNSVFTNVIQKPLEDALAGGALMLAQVLAGLGTNGINLGKRDMNEAEMRDFFDSLTQALNSVFTNVIQKPLEDALAGGALMLAQVLAGLGTNGINLGKRDMTETEMRGFLDSLTQAINDVFTNVIQKPLEDALAGGALMLAQVLAGVGTNGVNLGSLLGKRDMTAAEMRGFLDSLTQALNDVFTNVIQKPLEDALAGGALMLAQVLAGVGTNGVNLGSLLGKRDMTAAETRDFLDSLTQALNSVFTNVIQKPLEDALAGGALMLAQVLAGLGTNGVNLGSLLGKRDLSDRAALEAQYRGIFDTIGGALVTGLQGVWNNVLQVPLENFIQNGALTVAQILANLGTNGVSLGKRSDEARGEIIDSLVEHAAGLIQTQVKPVLENALNAAALHLAGVLANLSQNLGRR